MSNSIAGFLAVTLSLLLVFAPRSVRAGSLGFSDVEQVNQNGNQSPEVRPRISKSKEEGQKKSSAADPAPQSEDSSLLRVSETVSAQGGCGSSSLEVIDLCDVTGTICEDCGEILLASDVAPVFAEVSTPGGGFPKLAFFSLAAIPLALIPLLKNDRGPETITRPLLPPGSTTVTVTPTPTPPPPTTPNPIPEPASLLLFGSGVAALGMAARRRRNSKLMRTEEE